jgi:RimJ/RimL family protein N-acetyltransferase
MPTIEVATARPTSLVRRVWPGDLPAFSDHLLRLDRGSRYDRFAMAVSDDFLRQYAQCCVNFNDVIYGYFAAGALRGAGELRLIVPASAAQADRQAEAAFSIETGFRRQSAGSELFARILRAARNRRMTSLYMTCLAHNRAMQNLARKFSADLRFETDDCTGRLVARAPTPFTVWSEAIEDAAGFTTFMFDLQSRVFSMHGARV